MKKAAIEMVVILVLLLPLMFWVMMPRTAYAPGYSEKNFSKIKIGMPSDDVVALIGNPVDGPGGSGNWMYSHPGHSPIPWIHWNERGLTVSNGVVVQIIRSYGYYED